MGTWASHVDARYRREVNVESIIKRWGAAIVVICLVVLSLCAAIQTALAVFRPAQTVSVAPVVPALPVDYRDRGDGRNQYGQRVGVTTTGIGWVVEQEATH